MPYNMPRNLGQGDVDVLLAFILDEEAKRKTVDGAHQVARAVAAVDKATNSSASNRRTKVVLTAEQAELKHLQDLARGAQQVQSSWRRLQFAGRAAGEAFQIVGLAATAIFVGALSFASKYVNSSKASTAVVQDWRLALNRLKIDQDRVGASMAQQMLPTLQLAAKLADSVTDFVEKHPSLIGAAVKGAGVVAGISAIGLAASKGFKIYADLGYIGATNKQVLAAAAMEDAAKEQVGAAAVMLQAARTQVTGTLVGAAGTAGATSAAALAAKGLTTNIAGRVIEKTTGQFASAAQIAGTGAYAVAAGGLAAAATGLAALTPPLMILAAELAYARKNNIDLWASYKQINTLIGGTVLGTFQGLWNSIFHGKNLANETSKDIESWIIKIGRVFGVVNEQAKATPTPGSSEYTNMFVVQNWRLFYDYNKQVLDVTKSFNAQKLKEEQDYQKQYLAIIADNSKRIAEITASYNLNLLRDTRDFNTNETQITEDYHNSRTEVAASYGEDIVDAEKKHQKDMLKLLEEHNDKVEGFAANRDALGYAREMRDYARKRRDAERDYLDEAGKRNRAFAKRLRDLDKQYEIERQRRLADFNQRNADALQDHINQIALMNQNQTETLKTLTDNYAEQTAIQKTAYDEQLTMLEDAFKLRLHDIDTSIISDYDAFHTTVAAMVIGFQKWLAQAALLAIRGLAPHSPTNSGHAAGGYLGYGWGHFGEEGPEFLLNNRSTVIAERMLGGPLSQERMLAALASGGSGSVGGGYSDHRVMQFNGMTAKDRDWVRTMIVRTSEQVLIKAVSRSSRSLA